MFQNEDKCPVESNVTQNVRKINPQKSTGQGTQWAACRLYRHILNYLE